jgi:hypothetical protein
MRGYWPLVLMCLLVLGGCKYFDTAEQAEGRCRQKGVGRLPAMSGDKAKENGIFFLNQYIEGCMAARGFSRGGEGKWVKVK